MEQMHLLVVSGRSGSGKSAVLNVLEDSGYFCMDNFPLPFLEQLFIPENLPTTSHKIAVSIDVRAEAAHILEVPAALRRLQERGINCQLMYLDANDPTLIRRFSETRRRHPLTNVQTELQVALARETEILSALQNIADFTIDTSHLVPSMLGDAMNKYLAVDPGAELLVVVQSFGFKRGLPIEADYVFDVRCLPNPFWIPELRGYSGQDSEVQDYLGAQPEVQRMVRSISRFLSEWIDQFKGGSRSYLNISIGCTGGRHRSVFIAEKVTHELNAIHSQVLAKHRDINAK